MPSSYVLPTARLPGGGDGGSQPDGGISFLGVVAGDQFDIGRLLLDEAQTEEPLSEPHAPS